MRAILVSVDYNDILQVTLKYNRHHFTEVMVVTTLDDKRAQEIARQNRCRFHMTDVFYEDGADFNKFRALEEALDVFGRFGPICIMDADILWPQSIATWEIEPDTLYTPFRIMWRTPRLPIPEERDWHLLGRLWTTEREYAGYTQIFDADTNRGQLDKLPWFPQHWKHAGGPDSFFQKRWTELQKKRPPFNVLHLGENGVNWTGRATPYLDGTKHPEADKRRTKVRTYLNKRKRVADRVDYTAEFL